MNTIKKAICIAAITASAGAHAATTVFESEALGGPSNDAIATAQSIGTLADGANVNVFGFRLDLLPGGSSVDYFSFSTSSALNFTFSVTTPTGHQLGNDPMVGLFNSSGIKIAENDDLSGSNFNSFLSETLSAGTYYLAVTGYKETNAQLDFSGPGDSNWPYVLNITAAVPEPESYAMFLAGLGLLGAVARRRKAA